MLYGYARVSTKGQSLKEQLEELKNQGVENRNIYHEKYTGTIMERPELEKLINQLKPNDMVIVTKLDRLARKTSEAIELIEKLMNMDVTIKVINLGTLENTTMGRMIYRTLLSVAEMERDMIVERTEAGKAYAKAHNPNYREGRKTRLQGKNKDKYLGMYEYRQNHTAKETSEAFGVSIRTVFNVCKTIKNEK